VGSLKVGTSGWSYKDWIGPFYPDKTPARDFLTCYASRFNIVEVDTTYYRIPPVTMVTGWANRTPDHFQFCVKAPSTITHQKILADCESDRDMFLESLAPLGSKLHFILLQFGYLNKNTFASARPFFDRLDRFLDSFPDKHKLAVEIRNKNWLGNDFFQLLKHHRVSYALTEHVWMPPVEHVLDQHDCLTGNVAYLRLIGDRKGIEDITKTWNKTVVDRRDRLRTIANALVSRLPHADIVAFVNNHYAGHAPSTVDDFLTQWEQLDRTHQSPNTNHDGANH
jgi:uncharacterized protein YecE (DUF72 family)